MHVLVDACACACMYTVGEHAREKCASEKLYLMVVSLENPLCSFLCKATLCEMKLSDALTVAREHIRVFASEVT